ncbi:DUF3732 domain-containing protein [Marinobacter salarius]|uniref:Chromosome partition protein Smc n=1 Tax=Marinobacter salarius TaxID=1420917 RepID=A0A1W6K6F5_9GAMM|nr:DUF3732 domain-containing protein [Marinobacter salarius]ARM82909.1 chromosome partition protein Smc [Marinobacter salarius]
MTMQIKKIALYGRNGERREIVLHPSSVNIITGASKKGKSSLLDIVEYCLGSSECNVAPGHISQTVAWYSILLTFPDTDVFIARAAPFEGQASSAACHLVVGTSIELPENSDLHASTNVEGVTSFLTDKLGIAEQVTEVPEKQTRSPITIAFKHSRFYLFQSQDEVAARRTLFHRQAEPHIPQAIKDTLPYFMGAAEDDRLNDLERLRELKREKTRLTKQVKEIEGIAGEGFQKGVELLAEAASLGLDDGVLPANDEQLLEKLQAITQWTPSQPETDQDIEDPLYRLDREYEMYTEKKRAVRAKLRAVNEFDTSLSGFEQEIDEQATRLRSIGLFESLDSNAVCPVCNKAHEGESQLLAVMHQSVAALDQKLEGVARSRPRVNSYVAGLRQEDRQLAENVRKTRLAMSTLREKQDSLQARSNLGAARQRVLGRLSLYLESTSWDNNAAHLKQRIATIEPDIEDLEKKLDPATLQERLDSQLSLLSEDMTAWARELKLEHSEYPIRLDVKALTVVAETPHGRIPLSKMGSGENWVGYHLVTYLALAKWFIKQNRPVGRFIFFDQPTQVYFPSDTSVTGDIEEIENDEDREAVKRMFKWIFKVVEQLSPDLQIIVTDHADIGEEWFQNAVVDTKWRGDQALIPVHWYES